MGIWLWKEWYSHLKKPFLYLLRTWFGHPLNISQIEWTCLFVLGNNLRIGRGQQSLTIYCPCWQIRNWTAQNIKLQGQQGSLKDQWCRWAYHNSFCLLPVRQQSVEFPSTHWMLLKWTGTCFSPGTFPVWALHHPNEGRKENTKAKKKEGRHVLTCIDNAPLCTISHGHGAEQTPLPAIWKEGHCMQEP